MTSNESSRAARMLAKTTYKICPWCREPIGRNFDMHHWLIKRGVLPKSKFYLIDTPENKMPVHHSCHMQYGQTIEFERRCAVLATQVLGSEVVLSWYNSVSQRTNLQPKDSIEVK